jgi:hypothetical protein
MINIPPAWVIVKGENRPITDGLFEENYASLYLPV